MTSTRLPGKVLADLAGQPALAHMISRARLSKRLERIVVATTINGTDDAVADLCRALEIDVFRGDEMDVLGRYAEAAVTFDADPIVRLTADCPIVDPDVIDAAIGMYTEGHWDYVSNCIVRTYPDGLDVEVFSRAALLKAADEASHAHAREHVTPYIRGDRGGVPSGDFRRGHLVQDADFSHIRWTVDTAEDLARVRELVQRLPQGFTWRQALSAAIGKPHLLGVETARSTRAGA